MAIDAFGGVDNRCKLCGTSHIDAALTRIDLSHDFIPIIHGISVTWVSRWEASCLCGWRTVNGLDSKLTAEIVAWIHLRRWSLEAAREFAGNRGIREYVYDR